MQEANRLTSFNVGKLDTGKNTENSIPPLVSSDAVLLTN